MNDKNEIIRIDPENKSWEDALKSEKWVEPDVNVYETDTHFFLIANMPGVQRSNIKITLLDGYLILMGRINFQNAVSKNYILKEFETGNYHRKIRLNKSVDESNIIAEFQNGQLLISLAKSDRLKTRRIEID